jgi:hypothetical protein
MVWFGGISPDNIAAAAEDEVDGEETGAGGCFKAGNFSSRRQRWLVMSKPRSGLLGVGSRDGGRLIPWALFHSEKWAVK